MTNRGQHADADVCNESNKKAVVLMSLKAFLISYSSSDLVVLHFFQSYRNSHFFAFLI